MRPWFKRLALAVVAAAAACLPARADPMFAAVTLNGADTGAVVTFERSGADLFAPWRDLKRIGLQVDPPSGANADSPADLKRIPGLKHSIDMATQTVVLDAQPDLLATRTMGAEAASFTLPDRAAWGAAVDYAVNVQGSHAWAGAQARIFGPVGVLAHGFVVRDGRYRRLDTNFIVDDPAHGRSVTVGDFVSDAQGLRRAVRAGGVRISSEPDLRPDLFTQPLVEVAGQSALPSTVELFVDGVRRYKAQADPGRFTVRTAPTVNSRGEVSLVVTDALGRQTVTSQSFYSSSDLLGVGATTYSLDFGALRENYSGPDDHYGGAFAAISLRRGLTRSVTVHGHAETSRDLHAVGAGLTTSLGGAALLSAAFDMSDSAAGRGGRLRVSAQRETRAYGLFATYERRTRRFRELGLDRADLRYASGDESGGDLRVGAHVRGDRWGDVSVGYNRRTVRGEAFAFATAAWSTSIGRSNLYANAVFARDRFGGRGLTIGFTTPLGGDGGLVSAGLDTRGGGRVRADASQPPAERQGVGWRIGGERLLSGGAGRVDGEVRAVSPLGEVAVGAVADRRGASVRAYASGSVVWLGAHPRLARQSGGGLALIETGLPDVQLSVENRPIGRTGKDGALLAVNLPNAAPSRISISSETVALHADIELAERTVRPPRAAAVRVSMPVRLAANAQLQVFTKTGAALPPGAAVRLNGQTAGVVGFDSWIYLKDVRSENVVEIDTDDGPCRLSLAFRQPPDRPLEPQVCSSPGGGGLLRISADGADLRPGRALLHGDDQPRGVRLVPGERQRASDGARRGERQVHVQRPGLPGLRLHLERVGRWLGLGRRPSDEPDRWLRHAELPAV